MDPVFKVSGKLSEEEYVRFGRFIARGQGRGRWSFILFICLFSVWSIAGIISFTWWRDWIALLIPLVLLGWYLWTMTIGLNWRLAKAYRKNKLQADLEYELSFFDDHYEAVSANGTSNIPYEKLHKIIETPTNIYLMTAPGQGTILRKEDFPEEGLEFVRKIKETYKL